MDHQMKTHYDNFGSSSESVSSSGCKVTKSRKRKCVHSIHHKNEKLKDTDFLTKNIIPRKRICDHSIQTNLPGFNTFDHQGNLIPSDSYPRLPMDGTKYLTTSIDLMQFQSFTWIEIIPNELVLEIFSYLSYHDLLNFELVSSKWKSKISDSKLWVSLLRRKVLEGKWKKISNYFCLSSEICALNLTNLRAKQMILQIKQIFKESRNNIETLTVTSRSVIFENHSKCLLGSAIDDQHIVVVFKYEIKIWNRRTLTLKTVIPEKNTDDEMITKVLSLNNGYVVFGTMNSIVKIFSLETENWITSNYIHQCGGVVYGLVFQDNILISRTLTAYRGSNSSSIVISHFSPTDKTFTVRNEIFLTNLNGYGMDFDGTYLVFHTVNEYDDNVKEANVEIRTRQDWKLRNQISIPYRHGSEVKYERKLIFTFLGDEFRIFQVETGECKGIFPLVCAVSDYFKLHNTSYPFVLTCMQRYDSMKLEMWNISHIFENNSNISLNKISLKQMESPCFLQIVFDDFQIIGFNKEVMIIYDFVDMCCF